ncbi:MAG: hypothetical protein K2J30_01660 [Clostridia bacterium]|nr:hypothetical protein [Clostridia bacterium]
MKKFRVALVAALMLLVSMLCLVACGSVAGTYKFDSMEMTTLLGKTTLKAGDKFMEGTEMEVELSADFFTMTLNSDGTCTMKSALMGDEEGTGTWEEKDGDIAVTIEGATQTFKKDGSSLVLDIEGTKITLKK